MTHSVNFDTARPSYTREPTKEEKQPAVRLARDLKKVTYPDRAKTKVRSKIPPGRLDTKRYLQRKAQRKLNLPKTAEPFRTTKRAKTVHTPIAMGVMCDVSGSMAMAQEPLAVARWVLAEALHQVQGKVAVTLFGDVGYPIQSSKERVKRVEVYSGIGGMEDFESGFSLLDSELDLIDGHGARLVVIITDGHFVLNEATEYAEEMMDECRRNNVGVIWLDINDYFARPQDCFGHGRLVSVNGESALVVAKLLGEAVLDEFRRVAPQHA